MRSSILSLSLALILLIPACGDDDDGGPAVADAAPPTADAAAPSDATPPGTYVPLITAEWTRAAGEEGYWCASRTLTEDVYVGAIRPIAPFGTHHTVVTIAPASGPDDPGSPCGVEFGQFYASGVGTEALVLPEGVALVAHAGEQVHLNLHLFNATESAISGTSGIEVMPVDAASVQHQASVSLHGPTGFAIPGDGQPYSFGEAEAVPAGRTIIAIFPHMHQVGSHFKAEIERGGGSQLLWDDDYQFESQEFQLLPGGPVTTQAGDALRTTCTWTNTTGSTITWGDSSTAEMCFSIIMSY